MRWSETSAKTKLDSIISEFYAEEKAPDIICTAYDGFAYAAEEILSDSGLEPGSDEWPMITGYGSEAQAVKDKYIPLILGGISIAICAIYVFATCTCGTGQDIAMAIFTAITQGILIAGLSTYVNQIVKQANKDE